jgi:hypothetical protein
MYFSDILLPPNNSLEATWDAPRFANDDFVLISRRAGVGSSIKDSLEREAVSQGIDHGVLMPSPSSLPLCSSLGYHALEEEALAKGGAELRSIRMWSCSSGEFL